MARFIAASFVFCAFLWLSLFSRGKHCRHRQLVAVLRDGLQDLVSDRLQYVRFLGAQKGCVSYGTVVHHVEEGLRRRQPPGLGNLRDYRVQKTCTGQNAPRFFRLTESEKRRSGRNRHIEVAMFLDSGKNYSEANGLVRLVPNGECNPAGGSQYPVRLRKSLLRPGKMQHSEIQDDSAETRIRH